MADIINLRTARKQKARAEKETKAQQNRVLFGQTKAEKLHNSANQSMTNKRLNGHKKTETPES